MCRNTSVPESVLWVDHFPSVAWISLRAARTTNLLIEAKNWTQRWQDLARLYSENRTQFNKAIEQLARQAERFSQAQEIATVTGEVAELDQTTIVFASAPEDAAVAEAVQEALSPFYDSIFYSAQDFFAALPGL